MTKKPLITPEERAQFQEAMKNLPRSRPLPAEPSQENLKTNTTQPEKFTINLENLDEKDWLSSEDCIQFTRPGLQKKIVQQLKRGQIRIEAKLDLHRLTIEEALARVDRFIDLCQAQNLRWVCIIHGKGHFSAQGKPILKNVLNHYLCQYPEILAYHSAKPKDGGTGALYVLLKRGN